MVIAKNACRRPVKIALIGMPNSGKTVLLAVLADQFRGANGRHFFLSSADKGNGTFKHLSRDVDQLRQGEWPSLTKKGAHIQLHWTLEDDYGPIGDIHAVDLSGEDILDLFGDAKIDGPEDKLPAALQKTAESLRTADIVLVLLDLNDLIDVRDREKNRQVLALADYAISRTRGGESAARAALICTKFDLCREFVRQSDGLDGVLKEFLPQVYPSHLERGRVRVFPVATVADTTVEIRDDQPVRVPAPEFKSEGLDELMDWLVGTVWSHQSLLDQASGQLPRMFRNVWAAVRSSIPRPKPR